MTRDEEIKQKARELALDWNVGRGNEFYYRLDKLVNIARWADQHQPNPWISVEERLPEEDPDDKGYSVNVIGLFSDGRISDCFCSLDEDIWFIEGIIIDRPTHWMPMPKV